MDMDMDTDIDQMFKFIWINLDIKIDPNEYYLIQFHS